MHLMTHCRRELSWGNLVALIIILVVGLILWPLSPKPNPNPSGIFLPNAPLSGKPILANQVQILQMMPEKATILGSISTKAHYYLTDTVADDAHLAKNTALAQQLAGAAGANAIVITQIGRTYDDGPLDGFILYATAISDS
ncbi:MAG: hypothetical protein NTV32_01240 [Gammaproteobacteria bacterium]|jgi:hypothetical protein|nr:hypothetical protein [Gammaproteobacteria bacterium]